MDKQGNLTRAEERQEEEVFYRGHDDMPNTMKLSPEERFVANHQLECAWLRDDGSECDCTIIPKKRGICDFGRCKEKATVKDLGWGLCLNHFLEVRGVGTQRSKDKVKSFLAKEISLAEKNTLKKVKEMRSRGMFTKNKDANFGFDHALGLVITLLNQVNKNNYKLVNKNGKL